MKLVWLQQKTDFWTSNLGQTKSSKLFFSCKHSGIENLAMLCSILVTTDLNEIKSIYTRYLYLSYHAQYLFKAVSLGDPSVFISNWWSIVISGANSNEINSFSSRGPVKFGYLLLTSVTARGNPNWNNFMVLDRFQADIWSYPVDSVLLQKDM